jgi:hypothetical protein
LRNRPVDTGPRPVARHLVDGDLRVELRPEVGGHPEAHRLAHRPEVGAPRAAPLQAGGVHQGAADHRAVDRQGADRRDGDHQVGDHLEGRRRGAEARAGRLEAGVHRAVLHRGVILQAGRQGASRPVAGAPQEVLHLGDGGRPEVLRREVGAVHRLGATGLRRAVTALHRDPVIKAAIRRVPGIKARRQLAVRAPRFRPEMPSRSPGSASKRIRAPSWRRSSSG